MSGNVKLSENEKMIAKAYARERYLWDDPFEAPSVPPKKILEEFIKSPEKVEKQMPGISEQISKDVSCKIALSEIELENDELLRSVFGEEPEAENTARCNHKAKNGSLDSISGMFRFNFEPHKGDVFYTTSKIMTLKNGRESVIYTFKPVAVLLLDNGKNMPWGDTVFFSAVVTSDQDGTFVKEQDIRLADGLVVHKWLSYFVSKHQLDRVRKVCTVSNIDEIVEAVDNYTEADMDNVRLGRNERRLFAMAKYVPIMAETNAKLFEMEEECEDSVFKRLQKTFHKFISEEYEKLANDLQKLQPISLPVAAAGGKESDLIIRSGENAEPKYFKAMTKGRIEINAENCAEIEEGTLRLMWSLDTGDEKIDLDDKVFTLRDRKTKERIGFGYIRNNIAYLEQVLPDKLSEPIDKAPQVILEVCI